MKRQVRRRTRGIEGLHLHPPPTSVTVTRAPDFRGRGIGLAIRSRTHLRSVSEASGWNNGAATVRASIDRSMSPTCPTCGGHQVRQITPGLFECISEVQVGEIPPHAGGPIPVYEPCGRRFQVGTAVATEPCALCGRYSVGKCHDCGCPLCGLHGTERGAFLCESCLLGRARERERQTVEREAAIAERRRGLNARLTAMDDADQIAATIVDNEADVAASACKEVWPRIARSGRLRPDCEVVTLIGRAIPRWFSSDEAWSVEQRVAGWRTPSPVTIQEGSSLEPHSATYDIVIDATGDSCLLRSRKEDAILILWRDERAIQRVVVPPGAQVQTTVRKFVHARRRAVVGGESVLHSVPEEHYVPAVASILRERFA
jgi:hypothetical protein